MILFILFIIARSILWKRSFVTKLPSRELLEYIRQDFETMKYLQKRMSVLLMEIQNSPLFIDEEFKHKKEDRKKMRLIWGDAVSIFLEFDILKYRYSGFYYINLKSKREIHSKVFAIGYLAFLSQHSQALFLSKLPVTSSARSILNEESISCGLPKDTFFGVIQKVSNANEILRMSIGNGYLKLIRQYVDKEMLEEINKHLSMVKESLTTYPKLFITHPLRYIRKHSFTLWYPVVKRLALGLSYMRATGREYFISNNRIQREKHRLEIGDIFLTKRNWHATNLGIPGYWTHSVLYIGTLNEMDIYFSDVLEKKASEIIKEKLPEVYLQMNQRDKNGYRYSAIEVKRPGVILSSLNGATNADSLAILRPKKVSKADKFKVICSAFEELGKPYDYGFDFKTDNALVCSELIYKAYDGIEGLTITPVIENDHLLFAPNKFAEKFDAEYGTKDQELDFVLFLDGHEGRKNVEERGIDEFRESLKRPKWYIVTNYIRD